MIKLFTKDSPYKKRARLAAILWTLLIFIACLTPGKEIPQIHVPLIDKWVHFVIFGVFAILWLCTNPGKRFSILIVFIAAAFLAWLTETLQGLFPDLGRTNDPMDILADCIGAILGILIFYMLASRAKKALQK